MLPTDDLFYALSPEPGLEQQISSAILAPDAMADTASRTLNDLRKKIRATENSIRDRLESMVRNMDTSKYLQESVVSKARFGPPSICRRVWAPCAAAATLSRSRANTAAK